MPGWNIADVFDVIATEVPDAPAVIQGSREISWGEFVRRARSLGGELRAAGIARQSTIALLLRNAPEYVESLAASFYASLASFNTNYRYTGAELVELWRDAAPRAVIFHHEFASIIADIRDQIDSVEIWICVHDEAQSVPEWAISYEALATRAGSGALVDDLERDGDDLLILYTGGTTGKPKGVKWRQDDLFVLLGNAARAGYPDTPDLDFAATRVAKPGRRHLPAAPLMHGAGSLTCIPVLSRGGTIVLLESPGFDPVELLDVVDRHRVNTLTWVGDAFARPVLDALEQSPGRWSLSTLDVVTSGGVLFSEPVKSGLLEHAPHLKLVDVFGSSEALSAANSVTSKDRPSPESGRFTPRANTVLIREDGTLIPTGSTEAGLIGFGGRIPVGYHGDPAATAKAFRVIAGERYSVPGDFGTMAPDGSLTVLGRGSSCINTGGEKVFPEEVEGVIARVQGVADAVVLGIAHERFGEQVVAAVQLSKGAVIDGSTIAAFVRAELAPYKTPRHVIFVDSIARGPNGKIDHAAMRAVVLEQMAVAS